MSPTVKITIPPTMAIPYPKKKVLLTPSFMKIGWAEEYARIMLIDEKTEVKYTWSKLVSKNIIK